VGLRWAEAVNLNDSMVDLDGAQLLIPRDLNKSRRPKPIPLAKTEVQLLREQRLARPAGSRVVFANDAGGIYSKSGFRSVWVPALVSAGFAHEDTIDGETRTVVDFKFHGLRHTAISLMARAAVCLLDELVAAASAS
jgi:integrase